MDTVPVDDGGNRSLLAQTNLIAPRGLRGVVSWLMFILVHRVIFAGLLGAGPAVGILSANWGGTQRALPHPELKPVVLPKR